LRKGLNRRGHRYAGIDFLRQRRPHAKHIVTNPPCERGACDAFIDRTLDLTRKTGGKIATFLNLSLLAHPAILAARSITRRSPIVTSSAFDVTVGSTSMRAVSSGAMPAGQPIARAT
jgi:hypothetical protein